MGKAAPPAPIRLAQRFPRSNWIIWYAIGFIRIRCWDRAGCFYLPVELWRRSSGCSQPTLQGQQLTDARANTWTPACSHVAMPDVQID